MWIAIFILYLVTVVSACTCVYFTISRDAIRLDKAQYNRTAKHLINDTFVCLLLSWVPFVNAAVIAVGINELQLIYKLKKCWPISISIKIGK